MNYLKKAANARKLLQKFGASFTFTRSTSTYNPATGVETPVLTEYTGYAVFGRYDVAQYNETVQAGDVPLILEAVSVRPEIGDTVDGYRVMDVAATDPTNAQVVIYELRLRR